MNAAPDPYDTARQYSLVGIRTLAAALEAPDTRVSVEAAIALLNFGHGQPLQRFVFDADGTVEINAAGESDNPHRANGKDAGNGAAHNSEAG